MTLEPEDRFEWERILLRCDLPSTTKLVGLALATFANRDGTNAHPGQQKLGAFCGLKRSAILKHLALLEDVYGLIECTFRRRPGPTRGGDGWANVYQLVIPDDLTQRVRIITDDDLKKLREDLKEVHLRGQEVHLRGQEVHAGGEEVHVDADRGPRACAPPSLDTKPFTPTPNTKLEDQPPLTARAHASGSDLKQAYEQARDVLIHLPDFGEELRKKARQEHGDLPTMQLAIIAAAYLTGTAA